MSPVKAARTPSPLARWLLEGQRTKDVPGPYETDQERHDTHPWWKVMCLTGVDYFSTLGYQPGIAVVAAGALSPIATLVLVALTLFGALPIYRRVAQESPHGEGSISMLAKLLNWWQGKLFILVLLGFVATDFVITITLSAADATAHIIENPFVHSFLEERQVPVTIVIVLALGAIFLKGFKEAIGIAVGLVVIYLTLSAVVIGYGFWIVLHEPTAWQNWQAALTRKTGGSAFAIIGLSLLAFPKLALGLSGFETGVAVMPLVKGRPGETEENPAGRIKNAQKLLTTAAIIMSVFLIFSSWVTTLLIPASAFVEADPAKGIKAGEADGRALAYIAHKYFGDGFGTVYDISTILILAFAGASAMAGLLNIVPRYLPRYGMAPEWTKAARPLVVVFTAIAVLVTIYFRADVKAQGGAYATGVLVLMTSAAAAVTISAHRRGEKRSRIMFAVIALAFAYTTALNIYERPDGIKIASIFIGTIVAVSLVSRVWRTLELRVEGVSLDANARAFVQQIVEEDKMIRLVPNHPEIRDVAEYDRQCAEAKRDHDLDEEDTLVFVEVEVRDASEFGGQLRVRGHRIGDHMVLRMEASAVPNALAALMLHLRDFTGRRPQAYFNWGERSPLSFLVKYLLSGQGDIAPITREILRRTEPDVDTRPVIHAAG